MADEPAAELLEEQPEEEEGGPIKSFLEHLEDLRWVLIKSGTAAGVAMLLCLLGTNYVVGILEWPLRRAPLRHPKNTQSVRVFFGNTQVSVFHVATNDPLASLTGTNPFVRLQIAPVAVNGQQILGVNA